MKGIEVNRRQIKFGNRALSTLDLRGGIGGGGGGGGGLFQ